MIQINIKKETDDQITSIELSGHADFADHGYDIVCAAVSSQVISVENSLHQLLNIPVDVKVNEVEGGYLKITLPNIDDSTLREQTQILLHHLELALTILMENYPEFITITYIN